MDYPEPFDAGDSGSAPIPAIPCPDQYRHACPEQGRRDGWTGEVMARFCEVLAETGIVTEACRAVGRSRDTAYSNRRRNPLFDAAWQAALSIARNRLADALLARSIEGSVDYFYRDGELVGERRYIDNRLAYAMLRRLDRQAEDNPQPVAAELARQGGRQARGGAADTALPRFDWDLALTALRTGQADDIAAALVSLGLAPPDDGGETDETDNPPDPDDEDVGFDDRVWEDDAGGWWTDYPPPPDFSGVERGRWGEPDYSRECTRDECDLLDAARDADLAQARSEDEAERDDFFAGLSPPRPLQAERGLSA